MIITDIETMVLKCNMSCPPEMPIASYVAEGFILLRVYTDEGLIGIGEPSAYGGLIIEVKDIIEKQIKPRFIGRNPFDVNILTQQGEFPNGSGYGNAPYNCAIAGMSQALWDIIGKAMDMPVYRLLNKKGDCKNRIKAYASGGMWYEDQDTGMLVEEVLECREMGYAAWKFRPATPRKEMSHFERNRNPPPVNIPEFIDLLEKIRTAVGDDFDLMVDAGCRFNSIEDALTVAKELEELNYLFFEEPMPRVMEDYHELRRRTDVSIAGGESAISRQQFFAWIENKALDIVQPDGNLAGITEVMSVASHSTRRNIPCILHN